MKSGSVGQPARHAVPLVPDRPGPLCECGAGAVIRCHFCQRLSCVKDALLSCAFNPSHRWVPPIKEHGEGGAL